MALRPHPNLVGTMSRRSIAIFLALVVAVLLAGVVAGAHAFFSGLGDLCANEMLADVPSPSGQRHAVVFLRDCGATDGFSTQVSVLRRGERLRNTSGNAFTADTGHPSAPSAVTVTWESENVLQLTYDPYVRTFKKETSVAGVKLVHPVGKPP